MSRVVAMPRKMRTDFHPPGEVQECGWFTSLLLGGLAAGATRVTPHQSQDTPSQRNVRQFERAVPQLALPTPPVGSIQAFTDTETPHLVDRFAHLTTEMEERFAALQQVVARLEPDRIRDAAEVVQENPDIVSSEITPEESVERIDAMMTASDPEREPSLTLFESILVYFMVSSDEDTDSFANLVADAWTIHSIMDVFAEDW